MITLAFCLVKTEMFIRRKLPSCAQGMRLGPVILKLKFPGKSHTAYLV